MRPDRLIAVAVAAVLAGGIAVAAKTTDSPSRPAAARHPVTAPTHPPTVTPAPTPKPTPARPSPKPRPTGPLFPLPAAPAYPHPCPPPPIPPGPPFVPPKPLVKTAALPAAVAVSPHHAVLRPIRGKGMWLTTWADSKVDVPAVIAKAKAAGLDT